MHVGLMVVRLVVHHFALCLLNARYIAEFIKMVCFAASNVP